jgi:hypothetical protein
LGGRPSSQAANQWRKTSSLPTENSGVASWSGHNKARVSADAFMECVRHLAQATLTISFPLTGKGAEREGQRERKWSP